MVFSHCQLSAELHFLMRFISTESSNHYELKGSNPVLLNFSLAVLIAAELLSATKWHWDNVRIWFTCRKTKKQCSLVWNAGSNLPSTWNSQPCLIRRRQLRMQLGLALFVFFCSSVFFAVHVHNVVPSYIYKSHWYQSLWLLFLWQSMAYHRHTNWKQACLEFL